MEKNLVFGANIATELIVQISFPNCIHFGLLKSFYMKQNQHFNLINGHWELKFMK